MYQWGKKADIANSYHLEVGERGKMRTIKVKSKSARRLLDNVKHLKNTTDCQNGFIGPDWIKEERFERKKKKKGPVHEMKKLIEREPAKYHYVKNNKVCNLLSSKR